MRRQHPIRGGRQPLPATVLKAIWAKIDRLAKRHDVSRSWVISVLLAEALNISDQEQFNGRGRS